ncbi:hypothetical protein CEXT_770881 [Caerostris extrusa]|uniref:Uncharacterized protein n=1 Tax=Caerostris extrusa TaxID=172846 RepID=A0AAV4P4S9_CAEEX|nr:hypothetical protein CEXT_770881 [Caerostris extrusa]
MQNVDYRRYIKRHIDNLRFSAKLKHGGWFIAGSPIRRSHHLLDDLDSHLLLFNTVGQPFHAPKRSGCHGPVDPAVMLLDCQWALLADPGDSTRREQIKELLRAPKFHCTFCIFNDYYHLSKLLSDAIMGKISILLNSLDWTDGKRISGETKKKNASPNNSAAGLDPEERDAGRSSYPYEFQGSPVAKRSVHESERPLLPERRRVAAESWGQD